MNYKLRWLILISCVTSTIVHAEKLLPVFSGNWYAYFGDSKGPMEDDNLDSCHLPISYKNENVIAQGASANIVYQQAASYLFTHVGCTTLDIDTNMHLRQPIDFPSQLYVPPGGTNIDFETILANNPSAPRGIPYLCNVLSINIEPSYLCPKGSRSSYDDQYKAVVCTTSPKVCKADVVARDLSAPGMGSLGHVALTFVDYDTHKNMVVEVLDKRPVVNINTLASFQQADKYWGEKYSLNGTGNITSKQAMWIIIDCIDQQKFDPEYTYTTDWQAGKYSNIQVYDDTKKSFVNQYAYIRGKFRCDTFVNYCYMHVIPTSMIPNSNTVLPKTTYETFLLERTDVPREGFVTTLGTKAANKSDVFAKSATFLKDNKVSTKAKILYLQTHLKSMNENQFGYTIDTLSQATDYSLLPWLINQYNDEINDNNKAKIISAISNLTRKMIKSSQLRIHLNQQLKINDMQIQQIEKTQRFFGNLLMKENNTMSLLQAIQQSFSLLPMNQENYYLISSAIERLEKIDNKIISNQQKYIFLLSMAFSTSEMKDWLLPRLIETYSKENNKNEFNTALIFIKKQLENRR